MEIAGHEVVSRGSTSEGVREDATGIRSRIVDGFSRLRGPSAALRVLVDVRDEEVRPLLWAMTFLFSLLAGNYLIRPVRDEMGIAGGITHLPALFGGTLLAMLVAAPMLSSRLRRRGSPGFVSIFRALQLLLATFFVAF